MRSQHIVMICHISPEERLRSTANESQVDHKGKGRKWEKLPEQNNLLPPLPRWFELKQWEELRIADPSDIRLAICPWDNRIGVPAGTGGKAGVLLFYLQTRSGITGRTVAIRAVLDFLPGKAAFAAVIVRYRDGQIIRDLLNEGFSVMGEMVRPRMLFGFGGIIRPHFHVEKFTQGKPAPAILLGRANPNLLAHLRALGRSGIPVHCILTRGEPAIIARVCRYAAYVYPLIDQGDKAVQCCIEQIADNSVRPPVVFCCGDLDVTRLARMWSGLAGKIRPVSDPILAERLGDKGLQVELAESAGISVPMTSRLQTVEDLKTISDRHCFPAICRPVRLETAGNFGRKIFVANNQGHLMRHIKPVLADEKAELLVQDFIPGDDNSLFFILASCDRSGKPKAMVAGRKLRQFPAGLMACGETIDSPEIKGVAEKLCLVIGLSGLIGLEVKRDQRDGVLRFIEANLRGENIAAVAEASGVNIILDSYLRVEGLETLFTPMSQRPALWRDAMMDAAARVQKLTGKKSRRVQHRSDPQKTVGATWAWDDPWPAAAWSVFKISRATRRFERVRDALSTGGRT